jgi:hypothetical protein
MQVSGRRPDSGDPAGWRPVRERRRISRFLLASGPVAAGAPKLGQERRCEVELTEIRTRGQDWIVHRNCRSVINSFRTELGVKLR